MLLFCVLLLAGQLPLSGYADGVAIVHGNVVLTDGHAVTTPIVVTLRTDDMIIATTLSDSTGRFQFHLNRPGRFRFDVDDERFQTMEQTIEITPGVKNVQLLLIPSVNARPAPIVGSAVIDVDQLGLPAKAVDEFHKAQDALRKDRINVAIERLEKAVKIAPNFSQAHWYLGLQYLRSDRYGEAEAELIRAAESNPRNAEPLVVLGLIYLIRQKPATAVEVLERAIDLNGGSARGTFYLGLALAQTGNDARSENMLERTLQLDATLDSARLTLAEVYMRRGKRQEAVNQLQTFLTRQPQSPQSASATLLLHQLVDRTSN